MRDIIDISIPRLSIKKPRLLGRGVVNGCIDFIVT